MCAVCVCVCVYKKRFYYIWQRLEKEHQKQKKRDGEIGEHKLNETGAQNMQ